MEKSRKCNRWRAAFDPEVRDGAAGAYQLRQQVGQGFVVASEQKPGIPTIFVDLQLAHITALAEQGDSGLEPIKELNAYPDGVRVLRPC